MRDGMAAGRGWDHERCVAPREPYPRRGRPSSLSRGRDAGAELYRELGPEGFREHLGAALWRATKPFGALESLYTGIDIASRVDILSSMVDPALVSLKSADARKLAREIVENGTVEFTAHARDEMAQDGLQTTDCLNLLRAGVCNPPEYEKGEYRYRVETARICVVVAFASRTRMTVITAWRKD